MSLFKKEKNEKIESVEKVFLRISGMRITQEFEIIFAQDRAEISEYRMYCAEGGGWERRLEKSAVCPAEEFLNLMNECEILFWDGFYGKHPRGVHDGEMFLFQATVNGGREIRAEGSQNFPKHYREFRNAVYDRLYERN